MAIRTNLTEVTPFQGERGENFAYGKETFLQEAETMAKFIGNLNAARVYSYFEENGNALKPVRSWTDLKLPADRKSLLSQIHPVYITGSSSQLKTEAPAVDISENILTGLGVSDLELSRISTRSEAKKMIPDYNIFNLSVKRKQVRSITFLNTLENVPEAAADASAFCNNKVKCWAQKNGELFDVFVGAKGGILAPENCKWLFGFLPNMTELRFNNAFTTANVTDMSGMFDSCENLTVQDLTCFDTSNVTYMQYMFRRCESLRELDLSCFYVSNMPHAAYMFHTCPAPKPDWYLAEMD